ncbi:hypothetical protein ACE7GA_13235 [Roseomonas sp. CCTCC AB2023176]|uniref:hypothetical protein n=1 Tax=Roseomonas sp. CCTCC AB2023176 TaxID=3342640 RepID=UPI0035D7C0EF
MRGLATALFVAGAAGVVATFVLAFGGDTGRAQQAAGAAMGAIVLGAVLHRRG